MNHPRRVIEIKELFRDKTRSKVIFAEEGLTIGKAFGIGKDTFIAGDNIAAFRFGIKELKGFQFSFGRQYYIELKDFSCNRYKIKFNTLYGIKNKEYYRVWADLLQDIWDYYMANQLNYYTEMYNIQQMFELAGLTVYPDGISWDKHNKLPWDKIALKSYQNYFMVHNIDDPSQYKCCIFSIDWNAVIVQSLLKDIIKEHAKVKRTIRRGL